MLNELAEELHAAAFEAGWWDEGADRDLQIATKLALIHSEVSEALEGFRKQIPDDHLPHRPMAEVELADALIRILDLAGACGFDIDGALREKVRYNGKRADHKREQRNDEGGKRF